MIQEQHKQSLTFNKQTHLIVNGLDTTDYGQKYEPFMISYEVFGTAELI
jgi:hypothetical protein